MLKTDSRKIYIAGPMTGMENKNIHAFNEMAVLLFNLGYEPVNPARHDNPRITSWATYMKLGLIDMLQCEGVLVLPGWENSEGACMEVEIATKLGIPVFYDVEELKL